jgi:hypothetical protein
VVNLTEARKETKKPNDFWSEWQDSNVAPFCLFSQHVVVTPRATGVIFRGT